MRFKWQWETPEIQFARLLVINYRNGSSEQKSKLRGLYGTELGQELEKLIPVEKPNRRQLMQILWILSHDPRRLGSLTLRERITNFFKRRFRVPT